MTRQSILFALCAVLAVVFVGDRLLLQPSGSNPADRAERLLQSIIVAQSAARSSEVDPAMADGADVDSLRSSVLARPLFDPDRRPPRVAARRAPVREATETRSEPVADTHELVATIVAEGRAPVALVKHRQTGATQRLGIADDLGDWQVSTIDVSGVLFVDGDDESVLRLGAPRDAEPTPVGGLPGPERRLNTRRTAPPGMITPPNQ